MKKILKQIFFLVDPFLIVIYRLTNNYNRPIPPARNRARVGSAFISQFMKAGRNCYLPMSKAIKLHFGAQQEGVRILDFGAGVGRTIQYFDRDHDYTLYACDVDSTAMEYLSEAYSDIQSHRNHYEPPLKYESNYFDIIYSVSIWTHLPLNMQEPWLNEIYRVLKPGGLALITTIGTYGYKKGTHLETVNYSIDELIDEGIKFCEYEKREDSFGTGPSYGGTYQTVEYTRKNWGKKFRILEIQEGVIDDLNDLVILKKEIS